MNNINSQINTLINSIKQVLVVIGFFFLSQITFSQENCSNGIDDDGIGLPQNFDLEKSNSIGIHTIYLLIKQINGNISWKTTKG